MTRRERTTIPDDFAGAVATLLEAELARLRAIGIYPPPGVADFVDDVRRQAHDVLLERLSGSEPYSDACQVERSARMVPTMTAAAYLGVSDRRVRYLVAAGRLVSERVRGRWFVQVASLDAYVAEREALRA